jgi:hypothetical protein
MLKFEIYKSDWLKCIKNILDRCGYSNVWISQGNVNLKWLSVSLKQNIFDQFQQKWRSDIAIYRTLIY